MNAASRTPSPLAQAGQRWRRLPAREQKLLAVAALVVLAALAWWLAVGPAIATLGQAPARHQALDAQLLRMRTLQAQADALKNQPRKSHDEAVRALEATTRGQLGTGARLNVAADRATVTLTGVTGDALAGFLSQSRLNAGALPAEARLNRNAAGAWEGTVVLTLPPRG